VRVSEERAVYDAIAAAAADGRPVVLATIVRAKGSVPRHDLDRFAA
jgi:xanthine/CO dehydrogenase XdhC/CoxF family maturation factor